MRHLFASVFGLGFLGMTLMGCGGQSGGQTGAIPPWKTGDAAVGSIITTGASPAPGQTTWACTVLVYTATGGLTPASTTGTCGSSPGSAPSGAISCQVTMPDGGAAVGWCLPGTSSAASSAPILASPSSITLTAAQAPSQTLTVSENGTATSFTATSSNTSVVTVSPPSSAPGIFTLTEVSAGSATITITDTVGNTITVPVTAQ